MLKKNSDHQKALDYHSQNKPGKLAIEPTKPLNSQKDLALAYSPGVAIPCLEIANNPEDIYKYTTKGNMVAVISNGTAVLGLGAIGAAASKPVMEGKAVLFKKFADIDSIDLEIDTSDPDEFINAVKHMGPSFGGINLEDIKAPECFIIERKLNEMMDIPVFHDDQHGTAIITLAGIINALYLTKREAKSVKIVVNGAGAAAISCINLIYSLGVPKENIILCDSRGVIYKGRPEGMNPWKEEKATDTKHRTLKDALVGADIFLGLSVKGAVSQDMVKSMAPNPIIFAMANPDPEITPEEIKQARDDAIIATGRSDYSNQVNNVMGFPYIFRGALDVRASAINDEMKIAAAHALAKLARKPVPFEVSKAYSGVKKSFGPDYIIPVPFDPRLISTIPVAVAKAAIETKVARLQDFDLVEYRKKLITRLNPALSYTHNLHDMIREVPAKRIIFAEGEEEEIIKAAMLIRDEKYGHPVLVGREERINNIVKNMGSEYDLQDIPIMNAALTDKLDHYIDHLYGKLARKGFLPRDCARLVKTDRNIFSSCMVACGDGDILITGETKSFYDTLCDVEKVIAPKEGQLVMGYSIILSQLQNLIIADSTICNNPTAEDLVKIARQTADISVKMGLKPKIALISHSNFGNPSGQDSALIQQAIKILDQQKVDFEYDGDISIEAALNSETRKLYPCCKLSGPANILIMPNLSSAVISTSLLKQCSKSSFIGPILIGFQCPVQIIPMNTPADEIVQMVNFAIIDES